MIITNNVAYGQDLRNDDNSKVYVINEYNMISKLQSMNDKELSDLGYDKNAIDEIRNFDYIKALSERASLNDETLLLYGYN